MNASIMATLADPDFWYSSIGASKNKRI